MRRLRFVELLLGDFGWRRPRAASEIG